ncbi:pentapeptide repeat-containing protein [Saccharothrix sp. S26]|nr:pentapeptide repeat-containing protein [Saccharothrix sp. S26]
MFADAVLCAADLTGADLTGVRARSADFADAALGHDVDPVSSASVCTERTFATN